jgi:hypothetical protein
MNSVSGFFPWCSTWYQLASESAAGPAGLVDGPLLGYTENKGGRAGGRERCQLGRGLSFSPRTTKEVGKSFTFLS